MIPALLTTLLQTQGNVIVPALQEELAELHAAGVDVTAHMSALNNFAGSLSSLTDAFKTLPAKPTP